MKSIRNLLLACASVIGIHSAREHVIKPDPAAPFEPPASRGRRTRFTSRRSAKGRVATTQRQRRKDRRRAHAAGVRHAFA